MANFTIKLDGLEELKDSINLNYVKKEVAIGVGLAALQLHSAISFAVHSRYNVKKELSSVLQGESKSTRKFGKNIIEEDLVYLYKPVNLAEFFTSSYIGNINFPARRPGVVHRVMVVRGRERVSFGYNHFGGFIPKGHRGYMVERTTKKRYPLHNLFGPSLSRMAEIVYDYDSKVQKVKEDMIEILSNEIKLSGKGK